MESRLAAPHKETEHMRSLLALAERMSLPTGDKHLATPCILRRTGKAVSLRREHYLRLEQIEGSLA